jgi:rare lipoprotein A
MAAGSLSASWRLFRLATALLLTLILGACAMTPAPRQPEAPTPVTQERGKPPDSVPAPADAATPTPRPSRGNPPFYDVMGQRYQVMPDGTGYREQGIASWYGREFHGRPTSSGETYDMYALTAAHKTLPLPTVAEVTNLATGKSIIVRINDRGPFVKDRLIDLSYAAARDLGFLNAGTTSVEVRALDDAATARAATIAPSTMYVQVAAFSERQNAEKLRQRLRGHGFDNAVIRYDDSETPALYRVRIGPVANPAEYDAVAVRVDELNVGKPRLVLEPAAGNVAPGG